MLDKNSDVSRLLNRLEAKGLIHKHACPKDKRAFDVLITAAGLDVLTDLDKKQKQIDNVLHLTEKEAEELSNLLDKGRG